MLLLESLSIEENKRQWVDLFLVSMIILLQYKADTVTPKSEWAKLSSAKAESADKLTFARDSKC